MMKEKVLIYGDIGSKVDGDIVSQQLRDLTQKSKNIDVHINSYGGDVQQGISIFSTIIDLNNNGANINTYVDGFASSIASIIAIAGKKIIMNDFARWMVHEAFFPKKEKMSDKDKEALANINDMLSSILSRRGIDTAEVEAMMKKETWINAQQAVSLNLVDEVTETAVRDKAELIMNSNIEDNKKIGIISNLNGNNPINIITNPKTKKMEKLIAKLGVAEETEAIAKIDEFKNTISELEKTKETLEAKNKELKTKVEESAKAETKTIVDAAVEVGKLDKEKAEAYYDLAPDKAKDLIEAIPAPAEGSIEARLKAEQKASGRKEGETDAEMYQRLMEKDPEALKTMRIKEPQKFKKLLAAWNEEE